MGQPPKARARILGANGKEMMQEWSPEGFVQPATMPTSVVNLSEGNAAAEHMHAKSEEEIERELESRGKKWHRCPICSTPYETLDYMQKCASQPLIRVVKNALESNGWVADEPVTFIADNRRSGRHRRRMEMVGIMSEWYFVRTPRGHEEMPLVLWHPYPAMYSGGQPPLSEMWKSLLLCAGQENKEGIMTAFPEFTRKPGDRRGTI